MVDTVDGGDIKSYRAVATGFGDLQPNEEASGPPVTTAGTVGTDVL